MKKNFAKVFISAVVFVFLCLSVSAQVELMNQGVWKADVCETGKVVPPAGDSGLMKNGVIKATFTIPPDPEHGGKEWPFAEVIVAIKKDGSPVSFKGVTKIEITYSSGWKTILQLKMKKKIAEEGAEHCVVLKATKGKFVTVSFRPTQFKQPGWTGKKTKLDLSQITQLIVQVEKGKGGTCTLQIKSLKITGL